jgi:hypothetical protein
MDTKTIKQIQEIKRKLKKDLIRFAQLPITAATKEENKKLKEKKLKIEMRIANGFTRLRTYKHPHVGIVLKRRAIPVNKKNGDKNGTRQR